MDVPLEAESEAPPEGGEAHDRSPRPLRLIGRRHLQSNNSWMHNSPRLMRGRERCTLLVHPLDAQRLGIENGALVAVSTKVSDEVMVGVVSLPHGWGHDREGVRLSVAAGRPGASFNDLVDEARVDPAIGTAVLSGLAVTVEPVAS